MVKERQFLGAPRIHVARKEDMAMRTAIDLSPLYRSSIGFDRVFHLLENANQGATADHWPPYDIIKTGEDDYCIIMAVAGFSQDELTITHEPNMLVVAGSKPSEDLGDYLHHGSANRAFQRRFELADHMKVTGAGLENGLLTIDLKREVPEELKPRRIEIANGAAAPKATNQEVGAGKQAA